MIYTDLTKKAMKIAYEAHKEQVDKSGIPYIYHPIHVAEQCKDEKTCAAALLHDVVEDCENYSFERLENEGISKEVVEALKLLTHEKEVPYLDYVNKIKNNEIAKTVKRYDLMHNLDDSRLDADVDEVVRVKLEKKREIYRKALEILS